MHKSLTTNDLWDFIIYASKWVLRVDGTILQEVCHDTCRMVWPTHHPSTDSMGHSVCINHWSIKVTWLVYFAALNFTDNCKTSIQTPK